MARRKSIYVSDKDWDQYKQIINDFIDIDSGKQPFLYLQKIEQPLSYGEDSGVIYTPIQLDGLFQYNYIKTWPTNKQSISGELDYSNTVLYISGRLLSENGFINDYGYWDFNWAEDRFILNGKVYKPGGDSQVAQAKDEALLFFIILQREDPEEQNNILNSYAGDKAQVVNNEGIWLLDANDKKIKDFCHLPLIISGNPDIPNKYLK